MEKKIWLIRHGQTQGNMEHRYVGTVDEPLCPAGRDAIAELKDEVAYPAPARVFVSPMIRCRETAGILFPDAEQIVVPGMEECDFGEFEYKSYEEMNGYPAYQEWVDSGGTAGFPGGETMEAFGDRIGDAFERMVRQLLNADAAEDGPVVLVCHGGSIMAILDLFSDPHRDYFEWQAPNGLGFTADIDLAKWQAGEKRLTHIMPVANGG